MSNTNDPNPDIHCFRIGEHRFVFDVNSNSIHLLDDSAWQAFEYRLRDGEWNIQRIRAELGEDAAGAAEELLLLEKDKVLFSPPIEPPSGSRLQSGDIIKSMCLNVAHACNMRCRYCFASEDGSFGDKTGLMSPEVGRKAVDFLMERSGDIHNVEVDFFGGEPLLAFDTITEVVRYTQIRQQEYGKNCSFTFTTNGLWLDDSKIKFLNDNNVSVIMSLDGRKEVNDRMRRLHDGSKSAYDRILPHFQQLAASRNHKNYFVRGTYTRHNLDFSRDVEHFLEKGFKHLSLEPVVCSPDAAYALHRSDIPVLRRQYHRLAELYIQRHRNGNPFTFFHFEINLEQAPCLQKLITGCGAGRQYCAVTPRGDIYPCHQFVGHRDFLMGNVMAGTATDPGVRRRFEELNVFTKEACKHCWARYLCGGGCAAAAYELQGDLYHPYELGCDLQKMRLEAALYAQVMIAA